MNYPEWLDEMVPDLSRQASRADCGRVPGTKEEQLDRLLERVKPENIHREVGTGHPVGREVW